MKFQIIRFGITLNLNTIVLLPSEYITGSLFRVFTSLGLNIREKPNRSNISVSRGNYSDYVTLGSIYNQVDPIEVRFGKWVEISSGMTTSFPFDHRYLTQNGLAIALQKRMRIITPAQKSPSCSITFFFINTHRYD